MLHRVTSHSALLVALLVSSIAHAEDEKKEDEKKEESRVQLNLELVIGAGKVDALNPLPPSSPSGQLRYERSATDTTAAGLVLSGRYDLSKNFNVGLRLPLAFAELRPDATTKRTNANLGNVELEAEFEKELSEKVTVFVGGHVALPTSSGDELPSDATLAGSQQGIDPIAADKYAINHAVSNVFGAENTALWLAGYLGLVPVVGMRLQFGRLRIEPYVKAEAMFSVRPKAEERAIVELVTGGRVGVNVVKGFDLGFRAWGNFTLTDHEGDLNIGVVEPEVRFGGDRWRVTAGVLIPFAGELTNPEWISGRLSASALF